MKDNRKDIKVSPELHDRLFKYSKSKGRGLTAQLSYWVDNKAVNLESFRAVIEQIKIDTGYKSDQEIINYIFAGRNPIERG